jgi:hypothetical protein
MPSAHALSRVAIYALLPPALSSCAFFQSGVCSLSQVPLANAPMTNLTTGLAALPLGCFDRAGIDRLPHSVAKMCFDPVIPKAAPVPG